jgi:hypothetical protein
MSDESRKLSIYREILELLLPHARNVETMSRLRRFISNVDLYVELELVHNVPPLLATSQFLRWDVYWLNTQARNYASACQRGARAYSERILQLIGELHCMVPAELRSELTWDGALSMQKVTK